MVINEWVECPTCGGAGGPPSHFDDETGRWHYYVCGRCGGNGGHYEPQDVCDDCYGTGRWETTLEDHPTRVIDLGECPTCGGYGQ